MYLTIFHRCRGAARDYKADVLHTTKGTPIRARVFRPSPTRLICGAANGHTADRDDFKFSFLKLAYFIGFVEPSQYDFKHECSSPCWLLTLILLIARLLAGYVLLVPVR